MEADKEIGAATVSIIDRLWFSLTEAYGPAGPFYVLGVLGVLLAVAAIPFVLRKEKDPLDRFSFKEDRLDDELMSLRTDGDSGALQQFGEYLEPTDEGELSETRNKLRAAGYKDASAVRIYYLARAGLGIGLLVFAVFIFWVIPEEVNVPQALAFTALFGLMGYFLPVYWVTRQIQARKEEIQNAFPDAMDMMLVCIEGGQSLDQAMARVGQEMQTASGALAEELALVSYEFRAGKDRVSVLRDFATRCGTTDVSSFVTVLIQSSAFGTSISQALRVYASEMRDKRLVRAEEKANVLPTKLTLGTMMFTVPPLLLILIGPAVIQIVRSLAGLGGGG